MLRPFFLAVLLLLSRAPAVTAQDLPDPVILVSLDSLHPDYLARGHSPTLQRLAEAGASAAWMRPSFPTKTFPNHYTLVTGLRPDRHGIVSNEFSDPELGRFSPGDRSAVEDARWWGGEPLWNTARNAGMQTATMFWPGSEAPIGGMHPDHWQRFDEAVSHDERIDRVLDWLALPEDKRPRLITLYFEHIDVAAHTHGPRAAQTDAAVAAVDRAMARLLAGLDGLGIADRVNLVIVSDHGMAEVSVERTIAIEDLVAPETVQVESRGEILGLRPLPGHDDTVAATLLGRPHPNLECWRREALPAHWHYGRNQRVPPLVCQADEGWLVAPRDRIAQWRTSMHGGAHGYAPEAPSMRSIFIAHGPAFRRGVTLPPFDNVHVYPLLAALLGVSPADNDGDLAVLAPALASTPPVANHRPGGQAQSASRDASTPR